MASEPRISGDEPQRTRSADYREFYSNSCNLRLSIHDLTLTFGLIKEKEPGVTVTEEQATITMSPSQFKAFLRACSETLRAHEICFGPVNVPDELLKPGRTAEEIVETVTNTLALTKPSSST